LIGVVLVAVAFKVVNEGFLEFNLVFQILDPALKSKLSFRRLLDRLL
jgi:hypothetical protein